MNPEYQSLLKSFHAGTVDENQRLKVERDLLTDPEILLDYLDMKRELEFASPVPQLPTQKLWQRLVTQIPRQRKTLISLSLGAAIAASLVIVSFYFLRAKPELQKTSDAPKVYFDSIHELSANSNVL